MLSSSSAALIRSRRHWSAVSVMRTIFVTGSEPASLEPVTFVVIADIVSRVYIARPVDHRTFSALRSSHACSSESGISLRRPMRTIRN